MYEVFEYKTREDEKYGRYNLAFKSGSYKEATKYADRYVQQGRNYQATVRESTMKKRVYVNRCGKQYFFIGDDSLGNITDLSLGLARAINKYEWGKDLLRGVLVDNKGKVAVVNEINGKVLIPDVFGGCCPDEVQTWVRKLILYFNNVLKFEVSKFTFVYEDDLPWYYFCKSETEVGAIDIYYDYF